MDEQIIEFIKRELDEIKTDIRSIDEKVDGLLNFKWKLMGSSAVVAFFISTLVALYAAYLSR